MAFRPILGAPVKSLEALRYPLFASYKLDGIRAIWYGSEFISRTCKTIPNRSLQAIASKLNIPTGWDGELIFGEPNGKQVFRVTTSAVMGSVELRNYATPIRFFVFDHAGAPGGFAERNGQLNDIHPLVVKLDQVIVTSAAEALTYEQEALSKGYEGIVLRDPRGPYKQGRSTLNEQYLLKVKRFTDAEARVIGFDELMHNANEAEKDERGYTKRSSHQDNKIPMGILGALVCEMGGLEFRIGTGFTTSDRQQIWRDRDQYLGQLAKFKYFSVGVKDAPRHPVFLGWRKD